MGEIVAIAVTVIGCMFSVKLAEKARNNKGTIEFISRVNATPELDEQIDT